MAIPIIGKIVDTVGGIISKAVRDKDLAARLTAELKSGILDYESDLVQAQASIVLAEAQGQSWLQRNWRPILMLTIVAIIANNYILFPYVQLFGGSAMMLDLPEGLWKLMSIGVGGYVVSRGVEKSVKSWKE